MLSLLDKLRDDQGQATAEYALVMVAAAAVALALILWAANTDMLPQFFNAVVSRVTSVVNAAPLG
jgi:Flp pilus assembly pilin Flp